MKCDTPVTLPGGLSAGCTLEAPHPGKEHEYTPPQVRFAGKVLFCPVCSTNVDPAIEGDTEDLVRDCETCGTTFVLGEDTPFPDQDLEIDEDTIEEYKDTPFILLCPQDQTQIDLFGVGIVTTTCPADACQLTFKTNLDPDTVAEHSMFG